MNNKEDYAILVNHVTKKFKVYYDKPNTLKRKISILE